MDDCSEMDHDSSRTNIPKIYNKVSEILLGGDHKKRKTYPRTQTCDKG